MTAQADDIDRRARRVRADAHGIDVALMRRPGALPPGEYRDVIDMLNDTVGGIPGLVAADPAHQLAAAELILALWADLLPVAAQVFWADPDDEGH